MKMKSLITSALLLLALLLPSTAAAYDFEVDGIYYKINGNEVKVTYQREFPGLYNDYPGTVVIPATVTYNGTTYSVTAIGDGAFCYCSGLTNIVIPNSVSSIGSNAFSGCEGLTSIDIPNSVTAIGDHAFDDTAWYNNQPDGLVYAGKVAYKYKGTMPSGTNMTFKEGTLGIADYAFEGCEGLTSIVIPNSVADIGTGAFAGCTSLTSIVVESGNPKYDSRNNCNGIIETTYNELIVGCKNTIIPNSVTYIGDWAFSGCTGLTSIVIPNSVTDIWESAFEGCTGLTSIVIPNSVTDIWESAFQGCTGLTSIVIPNSVTEIGSWAFRGCSELSDVYCYITDFSSVSCGNEQFSLDNGDYSGRTLHVLQGAADAYRADKNWYPYFGQIVEDIFMGD